MNKNISGKSLSGFDVLVIGGGHAGTEAALAAARMGCKTGLMSFSKDTIGQMSCNPAIGGLGKGQLVKEIDALFGEMGVAIDETGIQFRTLNASKGPAVRSSRAQADRDQYKARILKACEECPNLTIIEAAAGALEVSGNRVLGAYTEDGVFISARETVVTTGTFLKALMHTGEVKSEGGRVGEKASYKLSDSLASLGLRMGRMKTGTPARFSLKSIDLSQTVPQPGDFPIQPFSFRTDKIEREQIPCYITHTTKAAHDIIANNVDRSPMFNGQIKSGGPRYCPSIEDKVFRFKDKPTHNIFLEPEGFKSDLVYPNGISTSLPSDVQEAFVREIPGLRDVVFLKYGYAVEYDHVDPTELDHTLKPKNLDGIAFAGQINGTSGYEEAGAQGLIAGINAACRVLSRDPVILTRDSSYIAVMIDDLVSLGVSEPYRMFTSRAEYRLHLREDNADSRLTPLARKLGLVPEEEWKRYSERQDRIEGERKRFLKTSIKPTANANEWLKSKGSAEILDSVPLAELIRRPEIDYQNILELFPSEIELSLREESRLQTELKFAGYLVRQEEEIQRLKRMEDVCIPSGFSYSVLKTLSIEVREKLERVSPRTLGQAGRISGVTPAALSLLAVYLRKGAKRSQSESVQQ
jgi:tRNA uridine 5-carboxymethylaminomethyl modification enzyme